MPDAEPKSIPEVIDELKELTITYAKQETVDPLKDIGRYVGFGVGGSLRPGHRARALLGLAVLRALQTETGTRSPGNLTWIPYLITVACSCCHRRARRTRPSRRTPAAPERRGGRR